MAEPRHPHGTSRGGGSGEEHPRTMDGGGGRASRIARYVPILGWIRPYDRSWLGVDAIAGITLQGRQGGRRRSIGGVQPRHLGCDDRDAALPSPPRAIVLDAGALDALDLTSAEMLRGLLAELNGRGIDIYFAEVHAPVLERARRAGLTGMVPADHVLPTVDAAVQRVEGARP